MTTGCPHAIALLRAGLRGAALSALLAGAALAGPYTGTGGGPETTINAPFRTQTGQTVPPGRDAAPEIDPDQRTDRQRRLDGVLDSICETCPPNRR
ncbi:hypothetical protein [uncultured Methylobacterium sp.]|jgi:hypothetical protein|uniref:hypothetical protein n=1 Tax=uncultured Methylobacterium sp. TaxID=157278 RepID=UPI0026276EB1|nr:hypothetical protein [uncultured Methylobacterium sp.]